MSDYTFTAIPAYEVRVGRKKASWEHEDTGEECRVQIEVEDGDQILRQTWKGLNKSGLYLVKASGREAYAIPLRINKHQRRFFKRVQELTKKPRITHNRANYAETIYEIADRDEFFADRPRTFLRTVQKENVKD